MELHTVFAQDLLQGIMTAILEETELFGIVILVVLRHVSVKPYAQRRVKSAASDLRNRPQKQLSVISYG